MMYYTKSTGMFKVVFERNGNVAIEAPEKIYDGAIGANVFGNEFIGDYFYFDYSAKKDYVYRINVNKVSTTEKLEGIGKAGKRFRKAEKGFRKAEKGF